MVSSLKSMLSRRKKNPKAARQGDVDLKLRFREFKYLLRANNEALAIIADIQRQAGDGSAVGLDFLRSRYIDASAKVYKMIRHLNNISGGAYPQLVAAFNDIRIKIDQDLEEVGGLAKGLFVAPFEAFDPIVPHLTGNKASRLIEMSRAELPVPPGFVITTAAFHYFMDSAGLGGQLRQAVMLNEDPGQETAEDFSRFLSRKILDAPLPPELAEDIQSFAQRLAQKGHQGKLSFRSSAVGEDSSLTFAGLYRSLLGVDPGQALNAYRQVVAALYAPEAVVYRRQRGLLDQDAEMAVLVQPMLAPRAAGVAYTTDPLQGGSGPLVISAVAGLGEGVVDGSRQPDLYRVSRSHPPILLERLAATPGQSPPLTNSEALELARLALELEERFGCPQDVEWAVDGSGRLLLLQSRLLHVLSPVAAKPEIRKAPILSGGETAHPGAAFGPAFIVREKEDLRGFPEGAVLVAANSSPSYAAVLPKAAAVVTDVGGIAGHMAALAREMGIPALVGAGQATRTIAPNQEITVDATSRRVYNGRVEEVLGEAPAARLCRTRPRPVPPWLGAAELITKLTLTDPQAQEFQPANCATFHDILRFAHEMSFREMFRLGDRVGEQNGQARRLSARLPFELWLIDLGGGIAGKNEGVVRPEQVVSLPGQSLIRGLTDPAVDWGRPRHLDFGGLASVFSGSLLGSPESQLREMGQRAYAVISQEYLNFNCRVGYHYTALDSFCGPHQNDNYISFRFNGGAATADRRALRCELIQRLLSDLGFAAETSGDQVSGFLKKFPAGETAAVLEEMGRLILFTRQMDMLMSGRPMVERLARAFNEKDYNLETIEKECRK